MFDKTGQELPEMAFDSDTYKRFKAIIHKYEHTIKVISLHFYCPDSYNFRALQCDLSTYLWLLYRTLPPDSNALESQAWVHTTLYYKAVNLVRDEQRYQKKLDYDADLSTLADDDNGNPYVTRLRQLIDQLDQQDQTIILMYLDRIPVKKIAHLIRKTTSRTYQILNDIVDKLSELNKQMEYDNE